MDFVIFDLETYDTMPVEQIREGGISAAVLTFVKDWKVDKVEIVYNKDMSKWEKINTGTFIKRLWTYYKRKDTKLVTFNGVGFDFRLLAENSDYPELCREMAINHLDIMYILVALKGYPVKLEKILSVMTRTKKVKRYVDKDTGEITEISGKEFPELWRSGALKPCLSYLEADGVGPGELVIEMFKHKKLSWLSKKGKLQNHYFRGEIPEVIDLIGLPPNDFVVVDKNEFSGWLYEV